MTLRLILFGVSAALLVAGGAVSVTSEAGAADKKSARSTKTVPKAKSRYKRAPRPDPADCTYFDNGKPTEKLDFRNPCDVEEFWRRNAETGGSLDD